VLQQLFARVNSRVFLGEPLCRRQRWLDIAASYATHVMAAGMELRQTGRLAPLAQWWLPSCAALRRSVREADAMIMAVVRERRAQQQTLGAAYVRPNDALQWTIDQGESDATLAQFQLGFAFTGIHTTTVTMTHLLYDLCLYPEYVDVLRQELRDLLGGCGFSASSDVQKLWKMDSFMKESQRLHPVQGGRRPLPPPSPLLSLPRLNSRQRLLRAGRQRTSASRTARRSWWGSACTSPRARCCATRASTAIPRPSTACASTSCASSRARRTATNT